MATLPMRSEPNDRPSLMSRQAASIDLNAESIIPPPWTATVAWIAGRDRLPRHCIPDRWVFRTLRPPRHTSLITLADLAWPGLERVPRRHALAPVIARRSARR